ncbi:MAG: hypothetical protein AB8I69_02180 [Anaerolineae bacterium]|jgi:hypothetical protein
MKRKRLNLRQASVVILAGFILLALASIAFAQVSSNYDLSWHVIGGGVGRMESTGHSLQGTLGQTVSGSMSSTGHSLCTGYWCQGEEDFAVYLPLVLRDSP